MSRFLKREWLQVIILVLPFVLVAVLWNKIPERVPTHWNYDGQPDHYGSKTAGVIVLPIINILLAIFIMALERIDPKYTNVKSPAAIIRPIRFIVTAFMSALFCLTILPMAGYNISIAASMQIALPVLIFSIGFYLQSIGREHFSEDPSKWVVLDAKASHRAGKLAGRSWMAISVLYLLVLVFLQLHVPIGIFIGYLVLLLVLPVSVVLWALATSKN